MLAVECSEFWWEMHGLWVSDELHMKILLTWFNKHHKTDIMLWFAPREQKFHKLINQTPVELDQIYIIHWSHHYPLSDFCFWCFRDPHAIATKKDKILSVFMVALAVFSNMVAIYSDAYTILKKNVNTNAWFLLVSLSDMERTGVFPIIFRTTTLLGLTHRMSWTSGRTKFYRSIQLTSFVFLVLWCP